MEVVSKLIEHLQLDEEDLESRPMSSSEDIITNSLKIFIV